MMLSDLEQVIELANGSAEAPHWTRGDYEQIVAPQKDSQVVRRGIVAVDGTRLRGFAVVSWLQGESAELESVMVVKEYRRQRIGGALLAACMAWAAEVGAPTLRLEVRASNAAALELYRHHGFCSTGARRGYYSDPIEDALVLQVSLR